MWTVNDISYVYGHDDDIDLSHNSQTIFVSFFFIVYINRTETHETPLKTTHNSKLCAITKNTKIGKLSVSKHLLEIR